MIELGIHPEDPEAMLFHSDAVGKFMPADRDEVIEFIAAAKRGDFDGLFTDPPVYRSASAAAPAPVTAPPASAVERAFSEALFVGGPLHGETRQVPKGNVYVFSATSTQELNLTSPMPTDEAEDNPIRPMKYSECVYIRTTYGRKDNTDGANMWRDVWIESQVSRNSRDWDVKDAIALAWFRQGRKVQS
jgi:hypothetical protein